MKGEGRHAKTLRVKKLHPGAATLGIVTRDPGDYVGKHRKD